MKEVRYNPPSKRFVMYWSANITKITRVMLTLLF
ncbi:hypothetical protein FUAX_17920 [Fulvitalea axinellae]|uniref:Uncharacterized protein n=1 Tax=Fulvitalea axinellae TaxID=1182444 RepID=A0AAU9DAL3_9BACT|nr:hypothetical protein FUAX_17920 [Fulvitalea axinellae]